MNRNLVEAIMGTVVLMVAVVFVVFVYNTAQVKAEAGYQVTAAFYKIGGLTKGSDVRLRGIKVGTVTEEWLDGETYDAMLRMVIRNDVKLSEDTVASIGSEGILGGKYVRLEPGSSETILRSGGVITKTKDFRSLEDQVGEIIFLASGGDEKK